MTNWRILYQAAMLEKEPGSLRHRIGAAETAMWMRLLELDERLSTRIERHAIEEASVKLADLRNNGDIKPFAP